MLFRCLYWTDDGSPQASNITLGTDGDSTQDYTRLATVGNGPNDDCPSWSDYTCTSNDGAITLSSIPAAAPTARARRATKARVTHVKQKMPAHVAGTRGSKYVHSEFFVLDVAF